MKTKQLLLIALAILLFVPTVANARKSKECVLRVASFNLRLNTPSDKENAWPNRKDLARQLVLFHDFDIFGTQEGFDYMLDQLIENTDYARIGLGRDGEDDGEHSAIIYKKSRFQLLEHGDFWYSETPEHVGKGWDAKCCNRICSWGKFKDIPSGKVFYFFNSHFDHQGVVARRESAKLLLKRIREIAKDAPCFSTGDYNASPTSEPMQILQNDGLLMNAYDITQLPPYGNKATFHNWGHYPVGNERIDHILVTKGITILKYGSLIEWPEGKYPSDHFPIMAVAKF